MLLVPDRRASGGNRSSDAVVLGEDVTELLKDTRAAAATPEGRRRIDQLQQDADSLLLAANLQQLRGLEALELIGGPESRAVLDAQAASADDTWLKREARAVLARLSER